VLLVGEAAGAPFQQRLALAHGDDGYQLTATLGDDLRPWVRVAGAVPMALRPFEPWSAWSTGELDLTVDGTGVPLDLVRLVDPGFIALADEVLPARAGPRRHRPPPRRPLRLPTARHHRARRGVASASRPCR
jgi:hypothetical protein